MEDAIVLTGDGIDFFVMASLKGRLKMEIVGMKGRGQTAYSIAKEKYGLKGSRQSVLEQMEALVKKALDQNSG
jgi:hypothetical protein